MTIVFIDLKEKEISRAKIQKQQGKNMKKYRIFNKFTQGPIVKVLTFETTTYKIGMVNKYIFFYLKMINIVVNKTLSKTSHQNI